MLDRKLQHMHLVAYPADLPLGMAFFLKVFIPQERCLPKYLVPVFDLPDPAEADHGVKEPVPVAFELRSLIEHAKRRFVTGFDRVDLMTLAGTVDVDVAVLIDEIDRDPVGISPVPYKA